MPEMLKTAWEWLCRNAPTLVVVLLIVAVVVAVIVKMVRDRRRGRSVCCGDCTRCGGCKNGEKEETP